MTTRRLALFAVLLAALAGAAFLLRDRSGDVPPPPAPVDQVKAPAPADRSAPRRMSVRDRQSALGTEAQPETDAPPPPPDANAISMRVESKLAPRPLSEVPHTLIGAWDEAPGSDRPGAHRILVAVVEPSMTSPDLEQLVWDIRERHSDAEVLDVRVYDSAEAATGSSALDGGVERMRHLVAEVKRNDRLGFDQITVRGQVVGP